MNRQTTHANSARKHHPDWKKSKPRSGRLNFASCPRCEGLGVIGVNQTGGAARDLHLHSTLAVTSSGLPLGVVGARFDAPPEKDRQKLPRRLQGRALGATARAGPRSPGQPGGLRDGPRSRRVRDLRDATGAPGRRHPGRVQDSGRVLRQALANQGLAPDPEVGLQGRGARKPLGRAPRPGRRHQSGPSPSIWSSHGAST